MPFPEVKRVIYGKNPLDRVICQLRFPPILRIDADVPAEFQDRIRGEFPNFSESLEWSAQLPQIITEQIPPEKLRQLLLSPENKNYEFSSEDGTWKVNLTRTFIALTANKYERWEKFKAKLAVPLGALVDVYSPAYYTRIGLRYIDMIKRSALGLENTNWTELLQPYILGILGAPEVGSHIRNFQSRYETGLSDGQSLVRTVLGFVEAKDDGEVCYMIDSDFHNTNKTNIDAAMEKLEYLRQRGTRLFRWCITDRLHQAMEPQAL